MYIISKKKDYYDGVAGTMGIDKTIVYVRETTIIDDEKKFPDFIKPPKERWRKLREFPFTSLDYYSFKKDKKYTNYGYFIVGFCGKLYVGWKLYTPTENRNGFKTSIIYDVEFINRILKPRGFNIKNNVIDDVKDIQNYDVIEVFRKYNTPLFIYDNDYERTSIDRDFYKNKKKFIINPKLCDYEFYKIFNSVQTFQEISMFISGVLGNNEKNVIEVSDRSKIEGHGFDYKWSFRKPPIKRK